MQKKQLAALFIIVVFSHLVFLSINFSQKKKPVTKKSITINTYIPSPTTIQQTKSSPSSNPIKIYQPSQKQRLLKELKKTLSSIELKQEKEKKASTILSFPKSIDSLQIDQEEEIDYFLLLTDKLKEALELPDIGKVKLKLTLMHSGQVVKVHIIDSESEKNTCYLESQLINLRFHPFSGELNKEKTHTFTLTFCNEN